ncbi:protein DELAY OF GERMINATION 1-like [Gossypium arboreum]|nr:protein DELAY OF GERMINATION 1-like [Gossypium arboreum]
MLSPSSWTSTFEAAFLWIGGWRPTMAFHLLYSKSGIQLENQLYHLIHGLGKGDLGDLSPSQLVRIDKLQAKTVKEEKNISEKMAKYEGTLADSCMVKLTHMVSEMMRRGDGYEEGVGVEVEVEVELAMELKKERLKEMLRRADDLRLKTLKALIDIMTPSQGVHYLIAAAELHLRIHEWGKVRDGKRLSSLT